MPIVPLLIIIRDKFINHKIIWESILRILGLLHLTPNHNVFLWFLDFFLFWAPLQLYLLQSIIIVLLNPQMPSFLLSVAHSTGFFPSFSFLFHELIFIDFNHNWFMFFLVFVESKKSVLCFDESLGLSRDEMIGKLFH